MDRPRRSRISLDLLKGFEVAARHMSFTRAAQELFVTQSAVSREIKALEGQLGQPLFRRVNRGLVLTEAGQALYQAVEEAFKLIDRATHQVRRPRTERMLTVTCSVPFASLWLVPRLPAFASSYPDIDLRISATNEVLNIERERIDLAIRHSRKLPVPAETIYLVDEVVCPVCAPRLLRDSTRPLRRPEDLAHHVLLHFDNPMQGWPWLNWATWLVKLEVDDLMPAGALHFSHYEQLIQAAISGNGVGIGRKILLARHFRDKLLAIAFESHAIKMGAYYVTVASRSAQRPPARTFVSWLQDKMRNERD